MKEEVEEQHGLLSTFLERHDPHILPARAKNKKRQTETAKVRHSRPIPSSL